MEKPRINLQEERYCEGFDFGFENECKSEDSQTQEEIIQVLRLKTENRLLRQRLDDLEKKASSATDALIEYREKHRHQVLAVSVLQQQISVASENRDELLQRLANTKELEADEAKSIPQKRAREQNAKEELSEDMTKEGNILRDVQTRLRNLALPIKKLQRRSFRKLSNLLEQHRQLKYSHSCDTDVPTTCDQERADKQMVGRMSRRSSSATNCLLMERCEEIETVVGDIQRSRDFFDQMVTELSKLQENVANLEKQAQLYEIYVRRLQDENIQLSEQLSDSAGREREMAARMTEMGDRIAMTQRKLQEETELSGVKEVQHVQLLLEMNQRIEDLKEENKALLHTEEESRNEHRRIEELENTVSSLQQQIRSMKVSKSSTMLNADSNCNEGISDCSIVRS